MSGPFSWSSSLSPERMHGVTANLSRTVISIMWLFFFWYMYIWSGLRLNDFLKINVSPSCTMVAYFDIKVNILFVSACPMMLAMFDVKIHVRALSKVRGHWTIIVTHFKIDWIFTIFPTDATPRGGDVSDRFFWSEYRVNRTRFHSLIEFSLCWG